MILVCMGIAAAVFIADFIIKEKVEKSKRLPRVTGKGHILLRCYHNRGAMLNLGERHPKLIAILSVLLSLLVLGMLIISFGRHGNSLLRAGLSLLLGGAFSNTYDRLRRKYVVDYISFESRWKGLSKVVYNLSDFCILGGAMLSCIAC